MNWISLINDEDGWNGDRDDQGWLDNDSAHGGDFHGDARPREQRARSLTRYKGATRQRARASARLQLAISLAAAAAAAAAAPTTTTSSATTMSLQLPQPPGNGERRRRRPPPSERLTRARGRETWKGKESWRRQQRRRRGRLWRLRWSNTFCISITTMAIIYSLFLQLSF